MRGLLRSLPRLAIGRDLANEIEDVDSKDIGEFEERVEAWRVAAVLEDPQVGRMHPARTRQIGKGPAALRSQATQHQAEALRRVILTSTFGQATSRFLVRWRVYLIPG